MKIKTLYITNLGLLDNLAQTQILPYLEELSKKGMKITVLSFEKKKYLEDKPRVKNVEERLENSGIEWRRLLYHNRWGNILDVFAGFIKTLRIVRNNDIAILHARASIPVLIAWPAAKFLRRKVIYDRRGTMVGDFVDDINVKNIFSIRFFSKLLHTIDRFIVRHSNATVVLSEKAEKILKGDRSISRVDTIIENIPCCADISKFRDNKTQKNLKVDLHEKFVMSYLGSLGTCYLLKEMSAFFKVLKGNTKNALFLIISHTEKKYIENVLKNENMESGADYIIVNLNPEEVPQYLAQCDFSIMFIKPVLCKIGSSPTKFAESLAAGIPVCANRGIGDIDKFIENNRIGVIIEGFDEKSYKESIEKLKNLLLDKSLSDRCRSVARKYFSLEMGVERYYKIYEDIFKKEI